MIKCSSGRTSTAFVVFVTGSEPLPMNPIIGPPIKYTGFFVVIPPASFTVSSIVVPIGTLTVTG